jgi:hypothetical protein
LGPTTVLWNGYPYRGGNLGSALAYNFYRAVDKPKYSLDHGLKIGFMSVGLVVVVVLKMSYKRSNRKRELEGSEKGLSRGRRMRWGISADF